jgi:hypothetical protein
MDSGDGPRRALRNARSRRRSAACCIRGVEKTSRTKAEAPVVITPTLLLAYFVKFFSVSSGAASSVFEFLVGLDTAEARQYLDVALEKPLLTNSGPSLRFFGRQGEKKCCANCKRKNFPRAKRQSWACSRVIQIRNFRIERRGYCQKTPCMQMPGVPKVPPSYIPTILGAAVNTEVGVFQRNFRILWTVPSPPSFCRAPPEEIARPPL